jgi:hypothetical protein
VAEEVELGIPTQEGQAALEEAAGVDLTPPERLGQMV